MVTNNMPGGGYSNDGQQGDLFVQVVVEDIQFLNAIVHI